MQIRNAVILTHDEQPIRMSLDELRDFTGNVVFCRSRLSLENTGIVAELVGRPTEVYAAASDLGGVTVKP